MRLGGYIRVSSVEQVDGNSLASQIERIQRECAWRQIELVSIYRDEGVSTKTPLARRIGGRGLLQAIAQGDIDGVVAVKLDRLFRDTREALTTVNGWRDAGKHVLLLDVQVDTTTPIGQALLGFMSVFAQLERDQIRARTTAGLEQVVREGRHVGRPPYGYTCSGGVLVPDEQQHRVISTIKRLRAQGLSLRRIAARLNEQGIPAQGGGCWRANSLANLLKRL